MKWRKVFREYFSYSTGERRALLVLVGLLLMAFGVPLVWPFMNASSLEKSDEQTSYLDSLNGILEQGREDKRNRLQYSSVFYFDPNIVGPGEMGKLGLSSSQIKNVIRYRKAGGRFNRKSDVLKLYTVDSALYTHLEKWIRIRTVKSKVRKGRSSEKLLYLFTFDPNTLSVAGWDSLGVSSRVASRIRKYIEKGGRFEKKTDLQRIYGFSIKDYERIASHILIVEEEKKDWEQVSLNRADSIQLVSLPGIGPVLSERILKYRKKLGGFSHADQLLEVYGIRDSLYSVIGPKVIAGEETLVKININEASVRRLKEHPYISVRAARDIFRYRSRNGLFENVDVVGYAMLLPDSLFVKVRPYLSVR